MAQTVYYYKQDGTLTNTVLTDSMLKGQDIVSRFNTSGDYEVVELTDDITSNAFDGCPNCGSFEVVETFSTHYNRPLLFDKSNMSVTQTGSANDNGTGEIIRYVCAKCGKDLTDFDFSEFTSD